MRLNRLLKFMKSRQGKRTAKQFAADLGISAAYLSQMYGGTRQPSKQVLKALGMEKSVEYTNAQRDRGRQGEHQ